MGIKERIRNFFNNRKATVDILSILFGIGSWIAINGMWVELPIMVNVLPEQWNLAAYLSIIIQLANIGPAVYSLCHKLFPQRVNNSYIIHAMMLIGFLACFLLGFFWNKISIINGTKHSAALFVLLFFIALVDCCSSVLFFPFMGLFKKKYLTSFLIGESLSGFVPSLVSLGQGASSKTCQNFTHFDNKTQEYVSQLHPVSLPPRFSVEIFCFFLAGMMLTSWIAFIFLRYHRVAKSELVNQEQKSHYTSSENELQETDSKNSNQTLNGNDSNNTSSKFDYVLLLLLTTWICFLGNGFLPTVQAYSALPYGNTAYHLAINFSSIVSPAVTVLALFVKLPKRNGILIQVILLTLIDAFLLTTAKLSPSPPLRGTVIGEIIIVISWVLSSSLITFTKVCIANLLRDRGTKALFWYGFATQSGSLVGAIITYILTVTAKVFKSYNPC